MIKNVLTRIDGVELYGVVSLALFITLFVAVLVWMLRLKRPYLDAMSRLPLEGDAGHPLGSDRTGARGRPDAADARSASPIPLQETPVTPEVIHE
jgi:hypothetical protein